MSTRAPSPIFEFAPGITFSAPWGRVAYLHSPTHPVDVQGSRDALLAAGILDDRARIPKGIRGSAYTSLGNVLLLADGRVRVRAREHIDIAKLNASFQSTLARVLRGAACPDFKLPAAPKQRRRERP